MEGCLAACAQEADKARYEPQHERRVALAHVVVKIHHAKTPVEGTTNP